MDSELLNDFLVEAGELVEGLESDLMALETAPDDSVLNAIFRAFHTVKGGAGFLELSAMVDLCHRAEELCNDLRDGSRAIDVEVVDVLSEALDALRAMLGEAGQGAAPTPAPASLLEALIAARSGCAEAAAAPAADAGAGTGGESAVDTGAEATPAANAGDTAAAVAEWLTPDDVMAAAPAEAATDDEEITEDEFEALLDQLHGPAAAPGAPAAQPAEPSQAETTSPAAIAPESAPPAKPPTPESASSPPPKQQETSIRVDTRRLDAVMNQVGELVLARNRLKALRDREAAPEIDKAIAALDTVTSGLQLSVMQIRMQPVGKVFGRFPKIVRDLARKLDKEVTVELRGEDTELDKNLVESLSDPLVHLVRNAVDHGIEPPEARESQGKPRAGTMRLAAEQAGDHILISIVDDGAGIDPNALRTKAVEKGLLDREAAARLDGQECLRLIFAPGFSTRSEVSDVSGRGVGMDVVKSAIEELNGSVDIHSELGVGTQLDIRVPLTLAILPTLMASVGERRLAFPLAAVSDVIALDPDRMRLSQGRQVLLLDDGEIAVHDLAPWLGQTPGRESRHVVLVRQGHELSGFIVDAVHGREEVVIKRLGRLLEQVAGLAGAAVTGDGRVALILEIASLLKIFPQLSSRTASVPA